MTDTTTYIEEAGKSSEIAELACRQTLSAKLAKHVLRRSLQEYLTASAYFRSIGAQTPSAMYGGSRSMVYHQMLEQCNTLSEVRHARKEYKSLHNDQKSNHDEYGGVLRIAGYRLRRIPAVGPWLETKVKADDKLMAEAPFDYPTDCKRYSAPIDILTRVALDAPMPPSIHDGEL